MTAFCKSTRRVLVRNTSLDRPCDRQSWSAPLWHALAVKLDLLVGPLLGELLEPLIAKCALDCLQHSYGKLGVAVWEVLMSLRGEVPQVCRTPPCFAPL